MSSGSANQVDFVGIGAPKSGTTWISACLEEHPEVGFAPDKEVWYFADSEGRTYFDSGFDFFSRGPEWYHQQIPFDQPSARTFGEYTVSYLYDSRVPQRVHDYNPNMKILVALRNPVDMVYSWYWFNQNTLLGKLPETFEQALEVPYVRGLGHYHQALEPFFDRFSRDQIHVELFDDIREDPGAVLSRIFGFLEVDVDFRPAQTGEKKNVAKATRFQGLQSLGQNTYRVLQKVPVVSSLVSSRAFERTVLAVYTRINRVDRQYQPLSEVTRHRLTSEYASDITQLEELIERDLSSWRTPSSANVAARSTPATPSATSDSSRRAPSASTSEESR